MERELPDPEKEGPGFDPDRALAAARELACKVAARSRPPGREPGYRYTHGLRVAALAEALARAEEVRRLYRPDAADLAILRAGAVLHDVAREDVGREDPADHALRGAELARGGLAGVFPPAALDRVCAIIARHNRRRRRPVAVGQPDPVEVQLVQDADLVDHFGAMEVWLAAYRSAEHREGLEDFLAYFGGGNARRWRSYALEHANFEPTRRALRERIAFADRFARRLRAEADGLLGGGLRPGEPR